MVEEKVELVSLQWSTIIALLPTRSSNEGDIGWTSQMVFSGVLLNIATSLRMF